MTPIWSSWRLETGANAAVVTTPHAQRALDIGCGAGNFALRLLQAKELTLVDLSLPMLARARERVESTSSCSQRRAGADVGTLRRVPQRHSRYGYRDHVFDYIDREDSPRPLMYQLELLGRSGFSDVDVLHYNTCFAAFGAVKG